MSLRQQIDRSLTLSKLRTKQLLVATDGGQQVTCELECLESLACEFSRLTLTSDVLNTATPKELDQVSASLSNRLTYLLEPIRPVEFDATSFVVQMRSTPPHRTVDGTSYFEFIVGRSELELRRYLKQPGSARRLVPAQVTREVLLKLIGDFETVLHELANSRIKDTSRRYIQK
jgi:hypothetical protein